MILNLCLCKVEINRHVRTVVDIIESFDLPDSRLAQVIRDDGSASG
jgi:hypothetical protein